MGSALGPNIVTEGLILCWDPANVKSYSGSGTSITDLAGNTTITQSHGTFSSSLESTGVFTSVLNSGYLGGTYQLAFSYSASSDLASALSVTVGGWTIEEWINVKGLAYPQTKAGAVFSGSAYQSGAVGFDYNHGNTSSLRIGASDGGGSNYEVDDTLSETVALDTWWCRQLVYDRDLDEIRNYINGVHQDTTDTSAVTSSFYDGGGAGIGTLYGWFHYGERSLTKIYNKILSPTELQRNFNAIKGRFNL